MEEKESGKGNYVDTLSTNKLCTENINGNNKYAFPTSVEVHIILDENVDPLPMKKPTKDNGKVYII